MSITYVFALDEACPATIDPVCGAIKGACVGDSCVYYHWVFPNSCELQKSKATYLYNGVCSRTVSAPFLESLQKKTFQTGMVVPTASSSTTSSS